MATCRRRRRIEAGTFANDDATSTLVDLVVEAERLAGERPVFENVQADSLTPYSDVMKTRDQKESSRVKRPLNTFMVFARYMRSKVLSVNDKLNNAIVSKRLGDIWKTYSIVEKEPFAEEAKRLKELHEKQYPNYRYQPQRRIEVEIPRRRLSVPDHGMIESKRCRRRGSDHYPGRKRRRGSCCSAFDSVDLDSIAAPLSSESSCTRTPATNRRICDGGCCHGQSRNVTRCFSSGSDSGRGTLLNESVPRSGFIDLSDADEHLSPQQSCSVRDSHSWQPSALDSEQFRAGYSVLPAPYGVMRASKPTGYAVPQATLVDANSNRIPMESDRFAMPLGIGTADSQSRFGVPSRSNSYSQPPLSSSTDVEMDIDGHRTRAQDSIFQDSVPAPQLNSVSFNNTSPFDSEPYVVVPASLLTGHRSCPCMSSMVNGAERPGRIFMLVPANQQPPFTLCSPTGIGIASQFDVRAANDTNINSNCVNFVLQQNALNSFSINAVNKPPSMSSVSNVVSADVERRCDMVGNQSIRMPQVSTNDIRRVESGAATRSTSFSFEDYLVSAAWPPSAAFRLSSSDEASAEVMDREAATESDLSSIRQAFDTLPTRPPCDTPQLVGCAIGDLQ